MNSLRARSYVTAIIVLTTACAPGGAATREYEDRVREIGDEVFTRLVRAVEEASDESNAEFAEQLARTREGITAAGWAAQELRSLSPPNQYEEGHRWMIQYYELTAEFSRVEHEVIKREHAGADTSEGEATLQQFGDRISEILRQVHEALPFLGGTEEEIKP